ncbi:hypothetical protein WME94_20320 [Sorangium sp. So ce429]
MNESAADKANPARGPAGYENWKAALASTQRHLAVEVNLYSDAHITGELAPAPPTPYAFFNTIPIGHRGAMVHALTLRADGHLPPDLSPMERTDASRYHGGSEIDELAALLSLLMGVRLRPGGISRLFIGDDVVGRPLADVDQPNLVLRESSRIWRIPRARGEHNLNQALGTLFGAYPRLAPTQAIALVRAARLYQDALWVAEAQPELSWLFLVSAIEAVAVQNQVDSTPPVELLERSLPKLAKLLDSAGSEFKAAAALELHRQLRATGRFLDFTLRYLPDAPKDRPKNCASIEWDAAHMKAALTKIYEYRSLALHDGRPFPKPMSSPPEVAGRYFEAPPGLAAGSHGAIWMAKDMPMLLHVFEYITRGAIINWWRAIAPDSAAPALDRT